MRDVDATYLQTPGALDVLYRAAEAMPLGADVLDGETAFAIWAPTAVAVAVCLYDDGHRKAREQIPLDVQQGNGTWVGFLPNDLRGGYYAYLVDVFVPGRGWLALDPTHNAAQNGHYVRLAIGRDYADVPPTRGVYKGAGNEDLQVAVQFRVVA